MANIIKTEARILLTALIIVGIFMIATEIRNFIPAFETPIARILFASALIIIAFIIMKKNKLKKL